MIRNQIRRRESGFTFIELMIVVAIMGVLASVAIPSFRTYQWKAKRSEAFTNLSALAKTQKAYFALYDQYFGVGVPEPGATLLDVPTSTARSSAGVATAFAQVGWAVEGNVYFDYDTNTDILATPACACTKCFTSTAHGDVDGDGVISALMYVHPGAGGAECKSTMGAGSPVDASAVPIYDMVAPNVIWDDF